MGVLSREQRGKLEKAVRDAREEAEKGARAALQALYVDAAKAPSGFAEVELRNKLRAHARQLGDARRADGEHEIDHLVAECAYEHWHRMLFARFLAENGVLMHPDGVAVTLAECEELAADEGLKNGWEVAERYAQRMLPQIFRPDAPVLQVALPPEKQLALEKILADLPEDVFKASDALGWVYQFWQAKRKDEINASEVKIGADELPAVTQLFTEPYMVDFLLQNTLGAWWVGRHGRDSLPVEMPYLRLLEDGTPAAGTFEGWPKKAAEIKVLDPCCGSGHFLVAAFHILVPFRMREEGLDAQQACDAVLRDNLHGLEIDLRCTEIAVFALALAAWVHPSTAGYRTLPQLHIACSGVGPRVGRDEWLRLAGIDARLRFGMDRLYQVFSDAPLLGSLVEPSPIRGDLVDAPYEELRPLLEHALAALDTAATDYDSREVGIAALGLAGAAGMLVSRFSLVATNVPYLLRRKQSARLVAFAEKSYPDAKNDLATIFLERIVRFNSTGGTIATVLPQNWLFLDSYKHLRSRFLVDKTWDVVAKLGSGAFDTIGGEVVSVVLVALTSAPSHPDARFCALDVSAERTVEVKSDGLRRGNIMRVAQAVQRSNPDARIVFEARSECRLLSHWVASYQGIVSGDDHRLRRCFWEVPSLVERWRRLQSTVQQHELYGGRDSIVDWTDAGGLLARRQGVRAWGARGIIVSQMGSLCATLYTGDVYDVNAAALIPANETDLAALWCLCSSPGYAQEVRRVDQSIKVTNGTLVKVPVDFDHWRSIAAVRFPDGLPAPFSADPRQWIYTGTVVDTEAAAPLHVAIARLLRYRWPDQQPDPLDTLADDDGIVCIPPVRQEEPAADRLTRLLEAAYGAAWSPQKLPELLAAAGSPGKTLDLWLRDNFFEKHCDLFHQRPFIWHIWDGLKKDGFSALVNYHKLDHKLLQTLAFTYLGDWIKRQEHELAGKVSGASDRLAAARALQQKLQLILDGEAPHDIFVRWKPLHEQPIGWNPDVNDGVRLNIRPFVLAGVLRKNPKIKWDKDRGKDPPDAPWGEERVNERHLSLTEKRNARAAKGEA